MRRIRSWVGGMAVTLAMASACTGGSSPSAAPRTQRPPTAAPTADVSHLALDAAGSRLDLLLGGGIRPDPIVLNWNQVETKSLLSGAANTAFCTALDNSHAGDALASIVELGLNALSLKLRHKPLPDEAGTILGFTADFATESCPLWIPIVHPPSKPAQTPEPDWVPEGYLGVIGNPDLVWRWSDKSSYHCSNGIKWCWQVDVYARNGCIRLQGTVAVKDANGFVLETAQTSKAGIPAKQVTVIGFGSNLPSVAEGWLSHLVCT
jgi:hypothetical protein